MYYLFLSLSLVLINIQQHVTRQLKPSKEANQPKQPLWVSWSHALSGLLIFPYASYGIVIVTASICLVYANTREQIKSTQWPTTKATLVHCKPFESETSSTHHFFELNYTFEVDGKEYTGNRYQVFQSGNFTFRFNSTDEAISEIVNDANLQVSYLPDDPAINLLSPGFNRHTCWSVMVWFTDAFFWLALTTHAWCALVFSEQAAGDTSQRPQMPGMYVWTSIALFWILYGCERFFWHWGPKSYWSTETLGVLLLATVIMSTYLFAKLILFAKSIEAIDREADSKLTVSSDAVLVDSQTAQG